MEIEQTTRITTAHLAKFIHDETGAKVDPKSVTIRLRQGKGKQWIEMKWNGGGK
jgi:hypothetical protein